MKLYIIIIILIITNVVRGDVDLFGSLEQEFRISHGSFVIDTDDTYIGIKLDVVNTVITGYSVISLKIKPYATNDTIKIRDAYVGFRGASLDVRIGRMKSIQANIGNSTVDIFNSGNRVIDVVAKGRFSKTIQVYFHHDEFTFMGSIVSDENKLTKNQEDAYEIAVSRKFDYLTVYGLYANNNILQLETYLLASRFEFGAISISSSIENHITYDLGDVYYFNISSSIQVDDNIFSLGYHESDKLGNVYMVEATHPFSEETYTYVSYLTSRLDNTITIGFGIIF